MSDGMNAHAKIALDLGDARINVHLLTERVQELTELLASRDETIKILSEKLEKQMMSGSEPSI